MAEGDAMDVDVDAPTAKHYGDQYVDAGDFANAIGCYQDALNLGADADLSIRCHYNMANCYYHLGDQSNCLAHAYEAAKSPDMEVSKYALRLYFWGATGEKVVGIDG